MRFHKGRPRLLDLLRPHPKCGMRSYLMARWRMECENQKRATPDKKVWALIDRGIGGWRPGRHRLTGMRRPRRVINPAVRFEKLNRLHNEIIRRRRKQGAFPSPFLWGKRLPRKVVL